MNKPDEVQLLREQVAALTEQVAALSTSSRVHDHLGALLVVFTVIKWGMHVQRDCCNRKCF